MGSNVRRRLVNRWLGLGAAVSTVMMPTAASAQDYRFFGGGGAFVGVRFGSDHVNVGWGFEALLSAVPGAGDCSVSRAGGGPTVQFSMEGLERPLLVVGAHAGGGVSLSNPDIERIDISGELGLAMRFAPELDLGLHLGLVNSALYSHALFRALRRGEDPGDERVRRADREQIRGELEESAGVDEARAHPGSCRHVRRGQLHALAIERRITERAYDRLAALG